MPRSSPTTYFIPDGIATRHIKRAAADIDRDGIPHHRHSYRFDVFIGHKSYPPKYLISLAAKYATGRELAYTRFNAHQAVRYLRKLGYKVIDRRGAIASEDDESAFPEGRERYRLHRILERDSSLSKVAKKNRLEADGKLQCDVCGFDFARAYGVLGQGFIEAHHIVPVSRLDGKTKTRVSDLALVCSNCHRMLHRGRSLSVKELRRLVQKHATGKRVTRTHRRLLR
jgi:predicted HNH restriction endonuclease